MADATDNIKYLLEALRTPAPAASITPGTGPNAGIARPSQNPNLGPIEQRRDGYRLYAQEKTSNGETPLSYAEWISQEQ